jgi:rfaE bifunctional protein nucleotidyltransferase chain/domain
MPQLDFIREKIIDEKDLPSFIKRLEAKGLKTVFTNGVFDILHKGHVTLLSKAAELGDVLILGLNSDASVRTLGKGPERPINTEADRAFLLAGLLPVYAVVIFNEPTPYGMIERIEPSVLVKGGDYSPAQTDKDAKDYIVGSDLQRAGGRETVAIPLVDGYSSTAVINKMKDGES